MADIHIPGSALALFSGMLAAVLGAVGALFTLAWKERDRSDARTQAQYDQRYADFREERERLNTQQREVHAALLAGLRELTTAVRALGANGGLARKEGS